MPIDRLNYLIKRKIKEDASEKTGVSLVIGCPLPADLLGKIEDLKKYIDAEMNGIGITMNWRREPNAFHLTVCGLILPEDFKESHWPLPVQVVEEIKKRTGAIKGTELKLGSVGILGLGALAIGISDNLVFDLLKAENKLLSDNNFHRHGRPTKKIVVGRLKPEITGDKRVKLKAVIKKFKDYEIGSLIIQDLKLVKYRDTSLEDIADEVLIY